VIGSLVSHDIPNKVNFKPAVLDLDIATISLSEFRYLFAYVNSVETAVLTSGGNGWMPSTRAGIQR